MMSCHGVPQFIYEIEEDDVIEILYASDIVTITILFIVHGEWFGFLLPAGKGSFIMQTWHDTGRVLKLMLVMC